MGCLRGGAAVFFFHSMLSLLSHPKLLNSLNKKKPLTDGIEHIARGACLTENKPGGVVGADTLKGRGQTIKEHNRKGEGNGKEGAKILYPLLTRGKRLRKM